MTLDEVLAIQTASQRRRFGSDPCTWPSMEVIEYIRTQVLGATDELHEVLGETGWKPWKNEGYGDVNRDAYLLELADVLVFWTNLVVAVGGTAEEMELAIRTTQSKNNQRVIDGY